MLLAPLSSVLGHTSDFLYLSLSLAPSICPDTHALVLPPFYKESAMTIHHLQSPRGS